MYSLYFCPGTCSMAAHILLEECGAEYETIAVALGKGEQRGEEYRKINPHGKVPALMVDDKIFTQNVAILTYITSQFPDAKLAPGNAGDYAHCLETTGWLTSAVHPAFGLALHPERPGGETSMGEAGEKAIEDGGRASYWAAMQEIDNRLANREWMMGDQFTLADISWIPVHFVLIGCGYPFDEYPNITRWAKAFTKKKSYQEGIIKWCSDFSKV